MVEGADQLHGIGYPVFPFTVFDILSFPVVHRNIPLRRVILVSSSPVSGSGSLSGGFFPRAAPVVALGSVHAGDPLGGLVVSALGCLLGQLIPSRGSVHAGDPLGGLVVSARMGLGKDPFCPDGCRHAEDSSGGSVVSRRPAAVGG